MLEEPSLKNLTNPNYGKPAKSHNLLLQQLGIPHISSFNYLAGDGLNTMIETLDPIEFTLPNGEDRMKIEIEDAVIKPPQVPRSVVGARKSTILPSECRQRSATYKGMLIVRIRWLINDVEQISFNFEMGEIPIMLKSNLCHLNMMTPEELVANGEHEDEWGGYFIIKGHEKIIRILQTTRRNYPHAIQRPTWRARGNLFSDMGISIRCVKDDQTSTANVLHFVKDGTAKLMFSHKKTLFFVPLVIILKCLCNYVDYHIFKKLTEGYDDNQYYYDCVINMLRCCHDENINTHEDAISYLGNMFRPKIYNFPEWKSDAEVGQYILDNCVLIHLDNNEDKFNLLAFMSKKLFTFVQKKCKKEIVDSVMMQELLLGGHLYMQYLKEKMSNWLVGFKVNILRLASRNPTSHITEALMLKAAKITGGVSKAMELFLATGNISTSSGMGMMQNTGLVIIAENINRIRFMSHFRAIHRGSFFLQMRTTEARALLPEHWGFVCPVHTPDGAPCGLLNHLTMNCIITDHPDPKQVKNIREVLSKIGMFPITNVDFDNLDLKDCYNVLLDGKVLGYLPQEKAASVVHRLRLLKVKGEEIPAHTEICLVPLKKNLDQFPGLFLFTGPARMMRPVINLETNSIEYIGTFEQVFLEICLNPQERYDVTTHMEVSNTTILSNVALTIPLPDYNQSPRNMYQCQMGKQTMGTPCLNWDLQAQTKLYRLQTPHSPLFRTTHYDNVNLDDFPMGTNAIVAVISYTGYDMEDAIVINKMSEERGLAHGSIYKTEVIELENNAYYFCRDPKVPTLSNDLDTDGLPYIGRKMTFNESYYCYYDSEKSSYVVHKFKMHEECFIHSIRQCGNFGNKVKRMAVITLRIPRNPTVGDKFASRAGQKGICSRRWAAEDLPFTETGLIPDIIFNPHGFPSRMTIAMMVELMAGKSGACHGLVHDASPWKFTEENTATEYFGKMLEAAGYNYHGTETMYSGIDGKQLDVQIFFGIVHYQRLRHMVSDKWQVRSKGPIDYVTKQPLKGRKRGGGVRFGEMERDALIAHGTSFLIQDRLFQCSDKTTIFICTKCCSILSPTTLVTRLSEKASLTETKEICKLCNSGDHISEMQMPYIFKFFCVQLSAANINVKIHSSPT